MTSPEQLRRRMHTAAAQSLPTAPLTQAVADVGTKVSAAARRSGRRLQVNAGPTRDGATLRLSGPGAQEAAQEARRLVEEAAAQIARDYAATMRKGLLP